MSEGRGPFAKVYKAMWSGTLGEHWQAWTTFVWMLANCERGGIVRATPESIASFSRLPLEVVREGIRILEAPDPLSRTPDEEGRRILLLNPACSWGWRIVNLAQYREMTPSERAASYRARHFQTPGLFVTERDEPSRDRTMQTTDSEDREKTTPTSLVGSDSRPSVADRGEERVARVLTFKGGPEATISHGPGSEFVRLPCSGPEGDVVVVTRSYVREMQRLYPGAKVEQELLAMRGWLLSNTKKTARGMAAFVNRWLNGAQNRPGGGAPVGPRAASDAAYLAANSERFK